MIRNHQLYQKVELPDLVKKAIDSTTARMGVYRSLGSDQWKELAGYLSSNQELPELDLAARINDLANKILKRLVIAGAEVKNDEIKAFSWYPQVKVIYHLINPHPYKRERT